MRSILIPILMSSRFRCPDIITRLILFRTPKKQIILDRYTKNKTIPTHHTQNLVIFDRPHHNQIHFILHWNQVEFDPPHWNQVNLDHPHKIQVNLHFHTKNKWFSARVQYPSQFRPPTQPNEPDRYAEINSVWTTHTKPKSTFILILEQSVFRPASYK